MKLLIYNCFHWLGFHVTDYLLKLGYQINGYDQLETEKKQHLAMYFGRHNRFQMIKSHIEETVFDMSIQVYDDLLILEKDKLVTIHLPIVFGEWMPMNTQGIYIQQKFIAFDSDYFKTQSVYVKDIVKTLRQLIEASNLPSCLNLYSTNAYYLEKSGLENSIYIRNNRPIIENIDQVKRHYKRNQLFY